MSDIDELIDQFHDPRFDHDQFDGLMVFSPDGEIKASFNNSNVIVTADGNLEIKQDSKNSGVSEFIDSARYMIDVEEIRDGYCLKLSEWPYSLSMEEWEDIVIKYMSLMGVDATEYVVFRHEKHVHIVSISSLGIT